MSGTLPIALLAMWLAGSPADAAEGEPATCSRQEPQAFLVRGNFVVRARHSAEERERRRALHRRAIRYRTEQYGYFEGFGERAWSSTTPSELAVRTRFMGLPVTLNRRIVPALRCVEAAIKSRCAQHEYRPIRLSGLRTRNTYHTGEVSNHVYGIAIDIDPHRNTCCRCTAKWRAHPLCKKKVSSIYERMAMPRCWVEAFSDFGFYWLGHDSLQDTMHFEFLGDPELIRGPRAPARPPPEP